MAAAFAAHVMGDTESRDDAAPALFVGGAMTFPDEELSDVAEAAHAVVQDDPDATWRSRTPMVVTACAVGSAASSTLRGGWRRVAQRRP